jgi:hypothetical protein
MLRYFAASSATAWLYKMARSGEIFALSSNLSFPMLPPQSSCPPSTMTFMICWGLYNVLPPRTLSLSEQRCQDISLSFSFDLLLELSTGRFLQKRWVNYSFRLISPDNAIS